MSREGGQKVFWIGLWVCGLEKELDLLVYSNFFPTFAV